MDTDRFDHVTRAVASVLSRRALAGALGLGALIMPGLAEAKKKKKKCKKPKVKCKKKCCRAGQVCSGGKCAPGEECQFTKTATLWTLQGDCTITRTLQIPAGVTLDGNGKTIALSGPFAPFVAGEGGVHAPFDSGDLHDLTVDGSGITGSCDPSNGETFDLVRWGAAQIADVQIRDNRCGDGIAAFGQGDTTITRVTVSGIHRQDNQFGIGVENSSGTLLISDCTVQDSDSGIAVVAENALIEDNTLDDLLVGVTVLFASTLTTVRNNTITNVGAGIYALEAVTVDVTGNTVVGRGTGPIAGSGVAFFAGASGSASGNTISNFFDDNPGATSCGIHVAADAGAVDVGANTFPDPPGNEQDICDFS